MFSEVAEIALVAARLGQFQQLLKTRVILILNFTRPHAITYTNSLDNLAILANLPICCTMEKSCNRISVRMLSCQKGTFSCCAISLINTFFSLYPSLHIYVAAFRARIDEQGAPSKISTLKWKVSFSEGTRLL